MYDLPFYLTPHPERVGAVLSWCSKHPPNPASVCAVGSIRILSLTGAVLWTVEKVSSGSNLADCVSIGDGTRIIAIRSYPRAIHLAHSEQSKPTHGTVKSQNSQSNSPYVVVEDITDSAFDCEFDLDSHECGLRPPETEDTANLTVNLTGTRTRDSKRSSTRASRRQQFLL